MASDDDRPTKRHTTRLRGRASATAQLGRVQRLILRWLLMREQAIAAAGSDSERAVFRSSGVVWSKVYLVIEERESAVSEALTSRRPGRRSLESRGLVKVTRGASGGGVTHVKLTKKGRSVAETTGLTSAEQRRRLNHEWLLAEFGPRETWSRELVAQIRDLRDFLETQVFNGSESIGELSGSDELRARLLRVYAPHKAEENG